MILMKMSGRADGVFERVAHGVADHGGGVVRRPWPRLRRRLFDVLLAVVPSAAGVCRFVKMVITIEQSVEPMIRPPTNSGPAMKPHATGTTMASSAGTFISPMAPA